MFTSEIENELPLSRQQLNNRLSGLEEDGYVTSKKASGRRLWWLTDRGCKQVAEAVRETLD